jgi:hypothetical protein
MSGAWRVERVDACQAGGAQVLKGSRGNVPRDLRLRCWSRFRVESSDSDAHVVRRVRDGSVVVAHQRFAQRRPLATARRPDSSARALQAALDARARARISAPTRTSGGSTEFPSGQFQTPSRTPEGATRLDPLFSGPAHAPDYSRDAAEDSHARRYAEPTRAPTQSRQLLINTINPI